MSQAVYARTAHVPLDELTPFPGNAKRGDVPGILASLRRNGQYRSLVVREIANGPLIVLAGNHTMQALNAHGPGDCGEPVKVGTTIRPCGVCGNEPTWEPGARCEIVTCDDDTARRVNLVDNRSSEIGTYDFDALAGLLADVDDLAGTGYSDRDLEDISALIALPQDDVKGRPADPATSGTGDPEQHHDEDDIPDTFLPEISLRVSHATFDRWREALDAHPGKDDAAKLLGLLAEVEAVRSTV